MDAETKDKIKEAVFTHGLDAVIGEAIESAAMARRFEACDVESFYVNRAKLSANIAARALAERN